MSSSSRREGDGNGMKFRNKRCRCGRRAAVKISESEKNKDILCYTCVTKSCGFFEWCTPLIDCEGIMGEEIVSSSYSSSSEVLAVVGAVKMETSISKMLGLANIVLSVFLCFM